MAQIHPTAVVDPAAQLAADVEVGAYAVIGPHVRVGARTKIGAHCVVQGHTTIGEDNVFHAFGAIGGDPQDKKYAEEPTQLVIGDRNTVREFVTFNTGTAQDSGVTRIGNDNWIMAYVHIAHDVQLGSHTILANNATLAGHVHVGDWVIVGGLSGVHQFVKIGAHAMVGFSSAISQDVPPFVMADGNPSAARGFNLEGLRRRGFSSERLSAVKRMYRLLYREGLTLEQAREQLPEVAVKYPEAVADVALLQDFLAASTRGIVR